VAFFGPRGEYIISGSDDGYIFIWEKKTSELVQLLNGDKYVVNCIQGHPYDCALASSGIENDVKLWKPIRHHANKMKDAQSLVEQNKKRLQESPITQVLPLSLLRNLVRSLQRSDSDDSEEVECTMQ